LSYYFSAFLLFSDAVIAFHFTQNEVFQPPEKWLETENKKRLFPVGWKFLLAYTSYYSFVFVMGSDPNPNKVIAVFNSKRSMSHADSC
jgi:hypothetical protein